MKRLWPLAGGRRVDLNYFVRWRPWLWAKSVANVITFFGDLRGKRVLEIGGGDARMSTFFALLGAQVTMVDKRADPEGPAELQKWNVADRVRLIQTSGDFEEIRGEQFDAVFTKSVLWRMADLAKFLDQIDAHLAEAGKVGFIENYRGGRLHFWFRRNFVHRGDFGWEKNYHGITPEQIGIFREKFTDLKARRHLTFVYEIVGHKRPRSDQ